MDKIEDQDNEQEKLLDKLLLERLLNRLDEQEKDMILRRYYYNQTQTEIARIFQISQVQVSRMEKKILKKMREGF